MRVPGLHHDLVDGAWAFRGRRKAVAALHLHHDVQVAPALLHNRVINNVRRTRVRQEKGRKEKAEENGEARNKGGQCKDTGKRRRKATGQQNKTSE